MQFVARLTKKLLASWEVKILVQVVNIGSALVHYNTSFFEQKASVVNEFYKFAKAFGPPLLREKTVDIMPYIM